MGKTVLAIVAHTDDETLGLGGTLARHAEDGDTVYAMSMTDGVGARVNQSNEEVQKRAQASIHAGKILGIKWVEGGNFPDNAMDTVSLLSVTQAIEKIKSQIQPTIIYTHHPADLNVDHRIVSQATLTAFRPQPHETWEEIRAFEIASSTDYGHRSITAAFYPNLYVNIEKTWKKKLAALKEYSMEMRNTPHARSFEGLENLAKYRGHQSGLFFAEAFEVIRKVCR